MSDGNREIRLISRNVSCYEIVGRAIPADGLPPSHCLRPATVEILDRYGWTPLCTQHAERRGYQAKLILEAVKLGGRS